MKILLSAFACEPGQGSEAGVGWGVAWNLAQNHRVRVITTPRHRMAIERFLATQPRPNLSFAYFDFAPAVLRCLVNSAIWQFYYHAWQHRIGAWAAGCAAEFDPDIVHHVTYGRYWTPSTLWKLKKPFVWGPLGGGDVCPASFLSTLSPREKLGERLRGLAQRLAHLDPELRATARHSALAIASTPATQHRLRELGCRRTTLILQMALGSDFLSLAPRPMPREKIFCSVGRLLGWKGHSLTLRAFAKASMPDTRLVIIGDGPAKPRLQHLAHSLGLAKSVEFLGAVPRQEALGYLARSIALVHPSLHDQAPTVVFEAMAVETPSIALNLGGLPLQITPATGFLLPSDSPEDAISGIADAMRQLAGDEQLRARLGAAGRDHLTRLFTWEKKAGEFETLYRDVLSETRATREDPTATAGI